MKIKSPLQRWTFASKFIAFMVPVYLNLFMRKCFAMNGTKRE